MLKQVQHDGSIFRSLLIIAAKINIFFDKKDEKNFFICKLLPSWNYQRKSRKLNGEIQRFVSNNYDIKDKGFSLLPYRTLFFIASQSFS